MSHTDPLCRNRISQALAIIAAICISTGCSPEATGNNSARAENGAAADAADKALLADAARIADSSGVSSDEAMRRLRIQDALGETIEGLGQRFRGRLAGISIDWSKDAVAVLLTGSDSVPDETAALAGANFSIVYRTGARATLAQLLDASQRHLDDVRRALPGLQGIGTDESTGELVLHVFEPGGAGGSARARKAGLERLLGVPMRIETVPGQIRKQDVRGGAEVSGGGGACTSGFVVKNTSNTTGIATAAHCPNSLTYTGLDGATHPLTFVTETEDADQDVQWHTSTATEKAEFYADTTTARTLTGRRTRASTSKGNEVCHRGITTGYSCGTVDITNYRPTTAEFCGAVTCDPVWVTVTGPKLACSEGDSGGPVFASQTAFGLFIAGIFTGPAKGQCSLGIYMSTDFLPTGVSLLFAP